MLKRAASKCNWEIPGNIHGGTLPPRRSLELHPATSAKATVLSTCCATKAGSMAA